MRQRTIIGWALGVFVLAQLLPALFFKSDWMLGAVASLLSGLGTGFLVTGARLDLENSVLSACITGLVANVVFVGALVGGFLNFSRVAAVLSGFAAANAAFALIALFISREPLSPFIGAEAWLGAMLWLCVGSCRVAYRASKLPSGTLVSE